MGKIVYLMGKSSSGKDTVFKKLMKKGLGLQPIVPYTTRPIRAGEENGVQYFFTDEDGFQSLCSQGKVIEDRAYHTMHGLWRYFTVDDGQILLGERSSIVIGTLEGYMKMKAYFGEEKLLPILIELDDGIRLQRALDRERKEEHPKYKEMCRRFLADCEDFSEEKIQEAGICRRFYNEDLEQCLTEIVAYIAENI
ncbi:MAG: guanylate kinase [Lachnospiraceae bacterium]|nr:guanylate kinase [Lachnospiraceae bacterium]